MAITSYERLDTTNDITTTRTLLHESIPLTGTIVSGTYGTFPDDNNIKNYTHEQFQSVYDYPFLSSSANHIYDLSIGFDEGSKEMSTCIFDLYKQSQSTSQSQTINQQNLDDNSGIRALLEEQKKQRQLEAALELMKQGSEMMNPPKPKLTCKYNPLTYKTVCN